MARPKHRFVDLTGQVFTNLTVIVPIKNAGSGLWRCRCECGKEMPVYGTVLLSGGKKSCGCNRSANIRKANSTHGLTNTAEYATWRDMRKRCRDPEFKSYHLYGGKGIKVCERWDNFENFLADMGPKPGPKYSIERLDGSKGYSPENCVWADWKTQARNRTNNHTLTFHGQTKTIMEWSEIKGWPHTALYKRVQLGWSDERILSEPVHSEYGPKKLKPNRFF